MGGETRPELQATVFEPTYPAGTEFHQDFLKCVSVTHATVRFLITLMHAFYLDDNLAFSYSLLRQNC
jgi:hypothetical protein